MEENKPIFTSSLKAKRAIWPPEVFHEFSNNVYGPGILLMFVDENDADNKITAELCTHQGMMMCVNILAMLSRSQQNADHKLSLELLASTILHMCNSIPACKGDESYEPETDPERIN